jgi:DNA ligase D-like protein (predicted 3'-phosphoesterase)
MLAKKSKLRKTRTYPPRFVIHKHDATHLHYDLRLEINGVLVSWALPKGPSTDPSIKRYAARVPDHALEYFNFEGVIPEGHYGAGPVMVWDVGTYENITTKNGTLIPLNRCLKEGHLTIRLHGQKLHGGYALIRTSPKKNWLFIKIKDDEAGNPPYPLKKTRSVLTGRTMRQILEFGKDYFE